jgi:hypothetical protein
MHHSVANIYFQNCNRCASNRCLTDQQRAFPQKMFAPHILPRIKKASERLANRIDSRNIWALMIVTMEAGQGEIFRNGLPCVFFGDYVVNFMS